MSEHIIKKMDNPKCGHCGNVAKFWCRCKQIAYCDVEHQRADWNRHRYTCEMVDRDTTVGVKYHAMRDAFKNLVASTDKLMSNRYTVEAIANIASQIGYRKKEFGDKMKEIPFDFELFHERPELFSDILAGLGKTHKFKDDANIKTLSVTLLALHTVCAIISEFVSGSNGSKSSNRFVSMLIDISFQRMLRPIDVLFPSGYGGRENAWLCYLSIIRMIIEYDGITKMSNVPTEVIEFDRAAIEFLVQFFYGKDEDIPKSVIDQPIIGIDVVQWKEFSEKAKILYSNSKQVIKVLRDATKVDIITWSSFPNVYEETAFAKFPDLRTMDMEVAVVVYKTIRWLFAIMIASLRDDKTVSDVKDLVDATLSSFSRRLAVGPKTREEAIILLTSLKNNYFDIFHYNTGTDAGTVGKAGYFFMESLK